MKKNKIRVILSGAKNLLAALGIFIAALIIPTTLSHSDEGISGSNAVININVTLNDSLNATIITVDTVRADTVIGSGGASFGNNVSITGTATADTVSADSVISTGGGSFGNNVSVTGTMTADTASVDSVISTGGGSFGNNVSVTGTMTADTASVDSVISTGGGSFGNNVSITGNITPDSGIVASAVLADSAAFVTTATRLAKYIPGTTPSDVFWATPRGLDAGDGSEALPVGDDLIKVVAKADSAIFLRPAGTTSGLKFNWGKFIKK